ncbi:MAG: serine/threonine-protein kinase [Myxococcota bacterium]
MIEPHFTSMQKDGDLLSGVAFGPYRVVSKIAGGGMAEVYKVYHEQRPHDPLALKIIRPDKSDDGSFRRMLIDEAKIAGRLKHPNIARVLGLHEAEGNLGLILEFVEGIDLIQVQTVLRERQMRFPLPVALYLLQQVLAGLDFAHNVKDERGEALQVVHRDVSPGNIMVDVKGQIRIVDWGIARAKNRGAFTDAGQVKGKFRYMAPEQITGKNVGPFTDVYAAALTFWEMVAGQRIYDELDVPQLMMVVSKGDAPSLVDARSDVPSELINVYEHATARSPERRYQTAGEFLAALKQVPIGIDEDSARDRLSQLPIAARLMDTKRGYERAVMQAKSAATEADLEGAVMRALEEPDRVERVDVDWQALKQAERVRAAERTIQKSTVE